MRDFNAKINEQLGDNFEQLNSPIERILVWQEAYRRQMSEMIDQQRATGENMCIAASRYSELVQQTERFSDTATGLRTLLTTLENQRELFSRSSRNRFSQPVPLEPLRAPPSNNYPADFSDDFRTS